MGQRAYFLCSLILVFMITAADSDSSASTSSSSPLSPNILPRTLSSSSGQPISITITTVSVTGTRYIKPPWPWVTGHVIFSVLIATYGWNQLRKTQKALRASPLSPQETQTSTWIRLLQYFNFLVALGAVVALVQNLINGYIFLPGLGMAIELGTLMICGNVNDAIYDGSGDLQNEEALRRDEATAWGPLTRLFFRANSLVFFVGVILYVVVGAYAANKGPSNSVMLVVNTGCDSPCFNKYTDQRLYQSAGGDELRLIAWAISCFFLGIVVLVDIFLFIFIACGHRALIFPHPQEAKDLVLFMVVLAGPLAIVASILDRKAAEGSFYDCTGSSLVNAGWCEGCGPFVYTPCALSSISFPGSASGFWDLWVRSKIAVLEGLVVW